MITQHTGTLSSRPHPWAMYPSKAVQLEIPATEVTLSKPPTSPSASGRGMEAAPPALILSDYRIGTRHRWLRYTQGRTQPKLEGAVYHIRATSLRAAIHVIRLQYHLSASRWSLFLISGGVK